MHRMHLPPCLVLITLLMTLPSHLPKGKFWMEDALREKRVKWSKILGISRHLAWMDWSPSNFLLSVFSSLRKKFLAPFSTFIPLLYSLTFNPLQANGRTLHRLRQGYDLGETPTHSKERKAPERIPTRVSEGKVLWLRRITSPACEAYAFHHLKALLIKLQAPNAFNAFSPSNPITRKGWWTRLFHVLFHHIFSLLCCSML